MARAAENTVHFGVNGPWTPLHIRFVEAYFQAGANKAAAARAAGSKAKNLYDAGAELGALPHVRKAIGKELTKALPDIEGSIYAELIERLCVIAFTDRSSMYAEDWSLKALGRLSPEQRLLVDSVTHQSTSDGRVVPSVKTISAWPALIALAKIVGAIGARGDNDEGESGAEDVVKGKVAKIGAVLAGALGQARTKMTTNGV